MTESKKIAEQKARKALEHIEAAQGLLGAACAQLSPIAGMSAEWELTGELYDKVHAAWQRINLRANAGDYDLDSDFKAKLSRR